MTLKYHVACVKCEWVGTGYKTDAQARDAVRASKSDCPECGDFLRVRRVVKLNENDGYDR